jgi:hypothetical protein
MGRGRQQKYASKLTHMWRLRQAEQLNKDHVGPE